MESDNKNKYDILVQLLSEGDAMVCLDARHPEVDVPKIHKDNLALSLVFNLNFRRPFDVQGTGIFATLAFGGRPHKCIIPFEAVWAIHEPESKKGQVWEGSFPKDLKLQVGANVKEASLKSEPLLMKVEVQSKISKKGQSTRSKKDRSHLKVIK
ncbi:ClpXP protease specificity-enhancing factor SspB [Nitrospinaceae bacterium]|nr:ClpXP protease specificity-enhancing factor SspB [Nitrospinaceae bacterium]